MFNKTKKSEHNFGHKSLSKIMPSMPPPKNGQNRGFCSFFWFLTTYYRGIKHKFRYNPVYRDNAVAFRNYRDKSILCLLKKAILKSYYALANITDINALNSTLTCYLNNKITFDDLSEILIKKDFRIFLTKNFDFGP